MALPKMTAKPNPKKLSPKDRTSTVTHLTETVSYNAKHSLNHALAADKLAGRLAKRYGNDPDFETLRHNAQHAAKHAYDVHDHSERLMGHLQKTYPGVKAAYKELMNPKPTDKPTAPGSVQPLKGKTKLAPKTRGRA